MEQGARKVNRIRALGFTPARAGVAACTLAVLVGGGLALSSGPAQTEGTTKISLSTVANASLPGSADHSALEEAARSAAVQKLAEAMKKRAAKEAEAARAGEAAKPDVASTTTGGAASATIARETPAAPASTLTDGAKVASTVSAPVRVASISPEDMQRLAGKAAAAIRTGDIASARLVLEHAARAGDATALYALAETYDPRVLTKLRVQGMTGDPEKARSLYRKALDSGVEEARGRLSDGG